MREVGVHPGAKPDRQRAILELIARRAVGSQEELAEQLGQLGFPVTQATVSRDIAELGLVKVGRGDGHRYVSPADLAAPRASVDGQAPGPDHRLTRLLEDVPVAIGRSGLTLVVRARPGMANAIAQAIDESSLDDQVGTLAGDDTVLVLFSDEPHLERWRERFARLAPPGRPPEQLEPAPLPPSVPASVPGSPASDLSSAVAPSPVEPSRPTVAPEASR